VKDSIVDFRDKLEKQGLSPDFFKYIKRNYIFYKSASRDVLFTGYYEARLQGSFKPSGTYRYPLYKKPPDLYQIDLSQFPFYREVKTQTGNLPKILRARIAENNTIVPYYSRSEIETEQELAGKKLEIAWCNDPVAVFFLQIQGSGVIQIDTGEILRVNYADSNGHPYRAIGRLLIERGILTPDNVSMQNIREYLENHPAEMEEIFNYNPSYVFFRVVEDGPLGFIDVPLTPYRSIALDRELFPKGALCYIETELPLFDNKSKLRGWKKFRGFVLNQDTGGAIRSPARIDLFTGMGEESELTAGHLRRGGTFYFLIKKQPGS
jgi:membrane-bound lytic murein transglycosylase A